MLFERLEDRVLFDAVPDASLVPEGQDPSAGEQANAREFDTSLFPEDVKVVADESVSSQSQSSSETQIRRELVIVDTSVDEYQTLVQDILNESDPLRELSVVTIDGSRDGFSQISDILSGYSDLDALHIVSHGDDSGIMLGGTLVGQHNLGGYAAEIAQWGNALSADGDLLLLGCDLASTADGREFLESISTLTGADVAASTDDTGYAARGGDWDLEFILGQMETTIAFSSEAQANWTGLLAPGPSVTISAANATPQIGSDVQLNVRFDNTAAAGSGDTGFGPYIDLLFPVNGADGAGGTDTPDGLDFNGATYLGQAVTSFELTFNDIDGSPGDNGTPGDTADDVGGTTLGYVTHPLATEIQNELQVLTFSGAVDGGSLQLSFDGQTTSAIDVSGTGGVLTAAAVQSALEGLSNIAPGDISVTGGSLPGEALFIEFTGTLAQTNVAEITVDNSLLENGGSTTNPHGTFSVNTVTNGSNQAQAVKIFGTTGDKLVVLELPFGSVTPEQPAIDVVVNASLSNLADNYSASNPASELTVTARSGFRLGADAIDNPAADPGLTSDAQTDARDWVRSTSFQPSLISVTTDMDSPEDESATGPNYPRVFNVEVDIPVGQTIQDLDISDLLPDNVVFLSLDSVTSSDGDVVFTTNVPGGLNSLGNPTNNSGHSGSNGFPTLDVSGPRADQSLVITADEVTGSTGADVTIQFTGYIAEFAGDAAGDPTTPVIPTDGEDDLVDSQATHTATAVGNWLAIDTRDQGGSSIDNAVAAPHSTVVDAKSLTIQKGVRSLGGSGQFASPGDILEYTLSFQISDYYTFGDLVLSDTFSDGQRFYNAAGFEPTFTLSDFNASYTNEQFNVHVGAENAATTESLTDNFIVDQSDIDTTDNSLELGNGNYVGGGVDPTTGSTSITIQLSERLQQLGEDGVLQGGLSTTNDDTINLGSARGTITFYTVVQQDFSDNFPSGDRSVDHDDVLTNNVEITGSVRENAEDGSITNVIKAAETDDSSASIGIEVGTLTKSIYAINGNTSLSGAASLQPGDNITYRLTYTLPNTDFESLSLTDFLPLPAIVVDDFDADDVSGDAWTFDPDATFDGISGTVELGPADTFYSSSPGNSDYFTSDNIVVDAAANSIRFDFGTYDDATSPSTTIDLLFTATVQDDPFADGLYLTNIARVEYGATNQVTEPADALVQIELNQPTLNIRKGIVDTDDPSIVIAPVGPTANNEFQLLTYTGSDTNATFTLSFGGQTTGDISVTATATTIANELNALSSIGNGDVIVSGDRPTAGPVLIEFTGALAETDVSELLAATTDSGGIVPIAVSTEFGGGDAITIGSLGDPTPFTGRITSSALDAQLIDADITTDGLESGDTVRFMIVVENTGSGRNGAFDVQVRDELPPEFEYVGGTLSVVDGQGTALAFTTVGTHPEHALFGSGIVLDDPGATAAQPDGEDGGSLDAYSSYDGRNIAVITYEAKLTDTATTDVDDVVRGETITNQAVLVSYAGAEGAEDHTASQNEVQTITPTDTLIGGTYTLSFDGQTTGPISFDAGNADVKAALESLSTIGAGNIQVSGGGLANGPLTVTFVGDLADTNVAEITIDESALSLLAVTSTTEGATNEIQRLATTGNVVGGFFTLTFGAETTAPLGFNASAATVQAALESLSSVSPGDVSVTGGAFPDSAINVEFTGSLAAQDIGSITFDDSNLSGGGAMTATTTTQGATNETQTLESLSTVSGGTFSLTFNGQTTGAINHAATAANIESALEALAGVSPGDVVVTGGPLTGNPVSIEFTGSFAGTNVPTISVDDSGLTAATNHSIATGTEGSLNEIQRLVPSGSISGGTFTLELDGQVTGPIGHNADAATIRAALEALENVPAGSVFVNGGSGSVIEIEFTGSLTQRDVSQLVVDSASLVGGTIVASTVEQGSSEDPRDPASLIIRDGSLAKSVVSTSEAHTTVIDGTERVTIGEIVRYRIRVELPEGTHSDLRIYDNLPSGLTYIDDGTAVTSFVTDSVGAITSTIGAGVLPDTAVSTTTTTNVDNYSSGRDVWFKLGDFTNTDGDGNLEYVDVEFNALVTNNNSSNRNNSKFNDAELHVDGSLVFELPNNERPEVIIAEPILTTPTKQVKLGSGSYGETVTADAADTVDFRIQFSNGNGDNHSDAFEVRLLDSMPTNLSLDVTSIEVYIGGVLQTAGGTYTDSSSALTDTIDLTIDTVAKGQAVEVRYSATVDDAVYPTEQLTNSVDLTWTSLPGANGTSNGSGGNSTGSDLASLHNLDTDQAGTDDSSGTTYLTTTGSLHGERDGSDVLLTPNDYYRTDTASVNVDGTDSIVKTLDGTSIDDSLTNANNVANEAVIGEIATYTVTVNFNESTIPNASIIDTLDPGLVFIGVTSSSVNGVTLDGSVDLTAPTVTNGGRTVTWDLQTITDSSSADAGSSSDTDGSISITYQAIVTNVIGNQSADTLNNTVEFQFDDDPGNAPNPRESLTASAANLTIIEPEVTVTKSAALDTDGDTFYDDGTLGDAGDAVQYTITLSNLSDVDAFDIGFSDALPTVSGGASAILSPAFSVSDTATTGAVSAADFELVGSNATGWTLQKRSSVNIDLLASQVDGVGADRVITFTVTGTIANNVAPNLAIDNTAVVNWSSLDGTISDPSSHTSDDTERTGADGPGAANLNNYENSATGTFTINPPVFTKHLFATDRTETTGTNVTVGEVVTYALVVSLPEGVVPDTTVIDLIPPGLDYLSHSIVTTAAASTDYLGTDLLTSDFNGTIGGSDPVVTGGSGAGDDVTFTFGQINVAVDNDGANNAFLILINAQVADVASTTGYVGNQDVIGNTATIDFSTDSALPQSSNTVNTTVVEPSLAISKEFGSTVNVDLADAGDSVSIVLTVDNTQGTSTAYDVRIEDTLNPLHYDLTSVSTGTSGVDYPADFSVNFNTVSGLLEYSGGDIAAGGTVTFTITVDLLETVTPNATLLNTATITDGSTLDGSVSGERNSPDADGDGSDTDTDTVRVRRNSLSGFVWDDTNNDGIFQGTESGLQNVDVRITGIDHLGNSVGVTVQTLADGSYLFDNLRPGTYTITQDPLGTSIPAGYLDGIDTVGDEGGNGAVNDVVSAISLPAGSETFGEEYNFAEIQDSSLSGSVYHDASNDGTFQGTETGINGVQVRLTGRNDLNQVVDITVTTSGGGNYSFSGLRPSDASGYTISQLANPTGYLDGIDSDGSLANGDDSTTNDVISSVNVVPGNDGIRYNFGEVLPSTLSGYVYHDSDNDGDRSDEPASNGIQNSRITLTGLDDLGNAVNVFADTDSDGYYEFTGLRPSNATGYTLTQTVLPAGFIDGRDSIGTPGGTAANNVFSGIVVASNTSGTENNFGELVPASLSGTVFNDHDNDGVFEPGAGETGIEGVSVRLQGRDDLGVTVDVVLTTNSNGDYSFTNLRPSDASGYSITETHPVAYNDGTDTDGSLSNGIAVNGTAPNDDTIISINVASGNTGSDYDFGEIGASISGTVYVDDDRDGSLETGENGRISGITVELFDMADPLNPVSLGTTTTAGDGTYSFDHLPAGDYRVVQTQPTQYGSTSANTIDLTLPVSGSSGNDFGESLFDIGNTVYFDANNDGVQNPGEEGIAGVDVTLQFAGLNGVFGDGDDPASVTVTTDASGEYVFAELFNGNYTVTVNTSDLPSGMTGTDETDDSAVAIDAVSNIVIGNTDRFDVDFGYTGQGSIGDFVFVDVDGDGLQDSGEPGLSNITVNLTFAGADGVFGNSDDLTLTTTTDSAGGYSFTNLPAGDFRVAVDTADADLPASLTAVSGSESISGTAAVTLGVAATNDDVDFGFTGTLSVGDRLWLDDDGDQVQDSDEAGLPEVEVTIVWLGQDGVPGTTDDFSITTTTDSNGNYQFDRLPDGNFRVTYDAADLPAGVSPTFEVDTTTNNQVDFTLSGAGRDDIDFGFQGVGSIGDFVFLDADADGEQDVGEPGLANVTVNLTFAGADGVFGTTDDFLLSTETNSAGGYSFAGLPDGNYRIDVDATDTDLPNALTRVSGTQSNGVAANVTLNGTQRIFDNVDFGFAGTRSIGDLLWLDTNGNGSVDGDEPGLGIVDITLLFAGQDGVFGNADDITKSTTTDANGAYSFTDLPEGAYRVSVDTTDLPTGTTQTFEQNDSANTLPHTAEITVGTSNRSDIDFGYQGALSIGNTVWFDVNGDGTQTAGEPGINNVDITLVSAGANGIFGDTDDFTLQQTTDASGNYQFTGLPQGEYRISVDTADLPAGMNVITAETDDSAAADDNTSNITLSTSRTDVDFGFRGARSLGDRVWLDRNGDGVQDGASEPGLGDVRVNLLFAGQDGTFGTADDIQLQQITDANGNYRFEDLPDGDYRVSVDLSDLPAGSSETYEVDLTTNNQADVSVSGTDIDDVDFGFRGTGSIGDRIWHDVDGDGVADSGEPGLTGVTVNLLAAGDDGVFGTTDDFVLSTVTGADGRYAFDQLPAGSYRIDAVESDIPGSRTQTFERDDATNNIPGVAEIALGVGQVRDDVDFAYTGTQTLGDRIWFDANNDGLQTAGEPGLAGVGVTLTFAGPDGNFATAGDNITLTTSTDANGNYQFARLFDGDYQVSVSTGDLPAGAIQTADTDDSVIATAALDHTANVRLASSSRDDADFGYRGNSSIGDFVFLDVDNSNSETAADRGLPGIDVTAAVDTNGDSIVDYTVTVTTDINGAYSFENLIPGTYTITVDSSDLPTAAAGSPTVDPDGTGTPHTATVVLGANDNNDSTDFGYVANGTIGDRVWLDTNGDGLQGGANEPGLANVGVTLTWFGADGTLDAGPGGDDEVFTTTTDSDGDYLFSFLPEGNFRIDVDQSTAPANTSLTTSNDPTTRTLLSGGSIDDADFGFQGGGSIGDFVFFDYEGDGIFNNDDVAWNNISVTLSADIDGDGLAEVFTATTDASGAYQFPGLPHEDYTVSIASPAGTSPSFDSDGTATANTSLVTLNPASPSSDMQDFGLTGTGAVGDTVFFDEDGDGLQGVSESGIPGVTVTVSVDLDGDNLPDFTATTTTDQDGKYSFDNLPAGQVVVTVASPSGTSPTTDHNGIAGGDNTNTVMLAAGATDDTSDFGYRGTGIIGDTVYFDANADGTQNDGSGSEPAEPGLPGVTVALDIDFNGDGTVDHTLTTLTSNDGSYQFSDLPAGAYTVRVARPAGTTPTSDHDGIIGGSADQSSLTLPPNGTNNDQDFGYTGTGAITDTVFFDIDNDATEEVGTDDRGIAGVDVTLAIDVNGDGTPDYTRTVQTDANGDFTFTNLVPGTYTVTTDPTDMRTGLANNPTVDNDGIVTPHDADYTVTAGNTTVGPGFGFHATPDYQITKTGDGNFTNARPGDTVSYTILVENIGQLDGQNVVVTDQFPTDVLTITNAPGGTVNTTAGTIIWNLPALNPGQQQILTVTAQVRNPVAAGINDFTNSVSVDDDHFNGDDPDTSNNSSSWSATLDAFPDYRIVKTDGPLVDSLSPGDSTTYTITVTNEGDQDGTGVVITDRFPTAALTVTNAFGGTVDATAGTITWNIGNVGVGDTVILQPVFSVITPADAAREDFTNAADVTDDGTNGADPNPGNNSDTDTNTLDAVPDYRITKTLVGTPPAVLPGQTVTYSLLIENIGDQDGTGVIVTDVFPTDTFENVTAPGGTVDALNGIITWTVGNLDGGGDSVLLTVTADIRSILPSGVHDAVNNASVTDDGSNGTDPTPSNNSDDDVTRIDAFPDLVIEKTDDDASDVRPGETVVYTISYRNDGVQDATGVVITETVPEGSEFNADDSTFGWVDQGNGQFTFNVGDVDGLAGGTIEFAVEVDQLLDPNREELVNTVSIADDGTNGPDSNPANNTAEDSTPLQVFTFDSFEDHSGNEKDLDSFNRQSSGGEQGEDPYKNRLKPLPIETVYTGIVDPGTTLSGKIYDQHGRMIGEQTVVADSAGNWLMQFPTVVLYETPHEMRIDQTLAVQNSTYDAGFNLRRFFHPAVHTQLYMNEPISIGSAFYHSPFNVLQAMHEANNNPLVFSWKHHNYELVVSSTNTSAM